MTVEFTRAEVCAVACAEAWRGDGEILASPFGIIPSVGARLARATFEPDLLLSDGEALLVSNAIPVGAVASRDKVVEGWLPFRAVFDLAWAGRRHAMMGAAQLDRFGNQNLSCIGPHERPTVQLIGARGAPGNTVNHAVSYWIPNHSPRVFVERVDFVSGVGNRRGPGSPPTAGQIRGVVTNLCVMDFEPATSALRVRSLHPGVALEDVQRNTGFELVPSDAIAETRTPTEEELRLIREVFDPDGLRDSEAPP